jgi:translation initiation factor 6
VILYSFLGRVLLFGKMEINGNPYVGIYCHTNEEFALVPPGLPKKIVSMLEEGLDVEVFQTTIARSSLMGVLVCSNSSGMVVTNFTEPSELESVSNRLNILYVSDVLNAVGNNILVNNNKALVHPDLNKGTVKAIQDTLGVEAVRGSIAKLKTVGAAAVVTDRGLLCHPHTSDNEKDFLTQLFGVEAEIGTANYGIPLVGACIIANSKGAMVGSTTTPIEMGRIEEALHL